MNYQPPLMGRRLVELPSEVVGGGLVVSPTGRTLKSVVPEPVEPVVAAWVLKPVLRG